MKQVPFYDVRLTEGFWADWQKTAGKTTVWAVYDRFYESGRIPTMDCGWKEGDPKKPHKFWGSDVFKWIEGAAYLLELGPVEGLREKVEAIIADMEKGIREDGYYNSYYNAADEPIYTNRDGHELYSLGHMLEAAVAWTHATGDQRLLDLACRGVDHACKVFVEEQSTQFATGGHEEIELALIRLWQLTGNTKHLQLAQFFLDQRGNNAKDTSIFTGTYAQDHLPVREQKEAVGHAVRAMYLYCAMADMAKLTGDTQLLEAVEALFTDVAEKKMYITGGIGSLYSRESFSAPYHLPNQRAYAETCAALALALFARRMSAIRPDGRYADVAERALLNGMLSGISLTGDSFFYVNPLELDQAACSIPYEKQHIPQRVKLFNCSCCPPNLVRLIPSIGDFVYTWEDERLYVHQFIANTATVDGCTATVATCYPADGHVRISCPGKKLAVRKPGWCRKFTASAAYTEKGGYLYFDADSVTVDFCMEPVFMTAASAVHADQGRVALMRGPIVYCAEGQDQADDLFRCRIDPDAPVTVTDDTFGGLPVLEAQGAIMPRQEALYAVYQKAEPIPCRLRLIPYFAFNNRGADDMQVWMLT